MVIQQSNEAMSNHEPCSSTQMGVNPKQDHKVGTNIYSADTEKSLVEHETESFPTRTLTVSQYQLRKVRTCVLGSSDLASSTQENELPRTRGRKSGSSANGTEHSAWSARSGYSGYLFIYILSNNKTKYATILPLFVNNKTKYVVKHHSASYLTNGHVVQATQLSSLHKFITKCTWYFCLRFKKCETLIFIDIHQTETAVYFNFIVREDNVKILLKLNSLYKIITFPMEQSIV